MAGPIY